MFKYLNSCQERPESKQCGWLLLFLLLIHCTPADAEVFTWNGELSNTWYDSLNIADPNETPVIISNWDHDGESTLVLPGSTDQTVFGDNFLVTNFF